MLYQSKNWSKFKLPTYGLKSHDASVSLNSFLSYLILYFYVYCVFWGEEHKMEQNYIFNLIFNRVGLRKSNQANIMYVKSIYGLKFDALPIWGLIEI